MKFNKWTAGLAAVGVVSLASAVRADETMSVVNTALSQTTLSGYVDVAAEYNPGNGQLPYPNYYGDPPGVVPSGSFAHDDGFSLNAVDIALDKPQDNSQWAAGYRVELMAGADAVGVPINSITGWNYDNENYIYSGSWYSTGATVRQAFIRLRTPVGNGIDWQIGVFDDIIGYESSTDGSNPNYTRSYGYSIEPTTLTGILATYKFCDEVSVSAGIANGAAFTGSYIPNSVYQSQLSYMASITLTAPDSMGFMKGATLSGGVVRSVNSAQYGTYSQFGDWDVGATCNWYVGATVPTPLTGLKVGASFDYVNLSAQEYDYPYTHTGLDIWDVAGYLTYQATDKLSFNFRAEYLDNWDDLGDYVPFPGSSGDTGYGIPYNANNQSGNFAEEITATVQYNLWANVISRLEFRWDHVDADSFSSISDTSTTGLSKENFFMLALNLIYQF